MALGIRTWAYALAGPSLGYALEFNFAAGIVGCHCAGVGDGARSATSAWESSKRRTEEKRRGGSAAGGVLVLNSNEETAHNERATSKAYAHSLAASFVCVCAAPAPAPAPAPAQSLHWEQRKTAQHESGKGGGRRRAWQPVQAAKECKENAAEMTKHEIRLRQMQ